MVNVEADVLAGAQLAQEAASAGVVYSMAYGDQPALTVSWLTGREAMASTWWLRAKAPSSCLYHASTPTRSGIITG